MQMLSVSKSFGSRMLFLTYFEKSLVTGVCSIVGEQMAVNFGNILIICILYVRYEIIQLKRPGFKSDGLVMLVDKSYK